MKSVRTPHVTRTPARGRPRAVVIGGGLAGLAAAGLLARDGYHVDLVEKNDRVGGRVDRLEIDGFTFDIGPTWYLMPEVVEHFFALMGSRTSDYFQLQRLDPAYQLIRADGERIVVQSNVDQVAELFESRDPGSAQAVRTHLASAKHTYRIALENFLYTNFQCILPWVNRDVLTGLPKLMYLLTQSLESHARRVTKDPVLQQMLTFHSVFLSAAPDMVPAMYHLMAHLDLEDGVYYPTGGMRSLVDAMEDVAIRAGVTIHTSTRATRILTKAGGRGRTRSRVTGVEVTRASTTSIFDADVVVTAADVWAGEKLLPPHERSYSAQYWRNVTDGIGTVLAAVGVEGELPELSHHTFFFTDDWKTDFATVFDRGELRSPTSLYVSRPTATDPSLAPPGHETLFVLIPVPASEAIGHGSIMRGGRSGHPTVEAAIDCALEQVSQWAGIPDLAERVRVRRTIGPADHAKLYGSRGGNTFGQAHTLSQSAFMRTRPASSRVDGLLFAGQTTAPGIGVPMALISAENVLKRLHGDTSASRIPEPKERTID